MNHAQVGSHLRTVLKIMRKLSAPGSGGQVDGDRTPAAGWPDSCESAAMPMRLSRA